MNYLKLAANRILLVTGLAMLVWACEKSDPYSDFRKPELVVFGNSDRFSSAEILFSADTVYVIASSVEIKSGSRWKIEAGTLIKVRNQLSLTVRPGATIDAQGTAEAPIIFTSAAAPGSQGAIGSDGRGPNQWNGLHIYGSSVSQPGTGSGSLSFVRVEFAGGNFQFSGLPSLLLDDVDAATAVHHVQVSYSYNADAFRFRGGNVSASHLVAYATNGRDFSLEDGYAGRLQFLLAYRHPFFPVNIPGPGITGMTITGAATKPVISNFTVLGPVNLASTSLGYTLRFPSCGLLVTGGAMFRMRNSVLMGFPATAFQMGERQSAIALQQGLSEFASNIIHSEDRKELCRLPANVFPPFGSADFQAFVLNPVFGNQEFKEVGAFGWTDPYNYDIDPNPAPVPASPVLTGADFSGADFGDPFFEAVTHIGALGSVSWLNNWTNFIPLQTVYNR